MFEQINNRTKQYLNSYDPVHTVSLCMVTLLGVREIKAQWQAYRSNPKQWHMSSNIRLPYIVKRGVLPILLGLCVVEYQKTNFKKQNEI